MNKKIIEECYERILTEGLGLNLNDPNLIETPRRIAKMYVDELFSGLNPENEPKSTIFPNEQNYDQIIVSDKIHFSSVCSHHFLPFTGYAYIMYIPDKVVFGLSKMSRIVDYFARRPQLQENMTEQIKTYIVKKCEPKGVMVILKALHQCMNCRGVKQSESKMITSAIYGSFKKQDVKNEALNLLKI